MDIKKDFKKLVIWLSVGIFASIVSHFIIELVYYNYEFQTVFDQIINIRPGLFILGTGILFIFYVLFASIFSSSFIGGVTLIILSWVVGTATSLKTLHRSEPIYPSDIYWLEEWPFLLEMIGWQTALLILITVIVAIGLLVFFYRKKSKYRQRNSLSLKNIIYRTIGVLISLGLLFYASRFNFSDNKIKSIYDDYANWVGWSQIVNYDENGFIAGFLYNLESPPMEQPENYSKQAVEEIFDKYKEKSIKLNQNTNNSKTDTNIIFIMNESFSDPASLDGLESNKDPLTNYREIIEESLSGELLVPGFGGVTATNEIPVNT